MWTNKVLLVSVVLFAGGSCAQNFDSKRTNDFNNQYQHQQGHQGQGAGAHQQHQQQQHQFAPNRNYNAQYYQPYAKPFVPITSYKNELNYDGTFSYAYTTGDGQAAQADGYLKNRGIKNLEAQVVQGSYSYTSPEGKPISVTYIADENGFRASGNHLPTPPPIPPEIKKSLELIARTQPVPSTFASQYQTGQYNQYNPNQYNPNQYNQGRYNQGQYDQGQYNQGHLQTGQYNQNQQHGGHQQQQHQQQQQQNYNQQQQNQIQQPQGFHKFG